jgi:WD40 repeat protein
MGGVDWHVRVDAERALEVRDRCLLLLLVFKRVVCADYCALYSQVSSVSFSPDGTKLASGCWDNSVRIWETSTGMCVSTLTGHRYTLFLCLIISRTGVLFSSDWGGAHYLLTASKVAGPGTRKRGDFAAPPCLKF